MFSSLYCSPEVLLKLYKAFIRLSPTLSMPHKFGILTYIVNNIDLLEKTQKFTLQIKVSCNL